MFEGNEKPKWYTKGTKPEGRDREVKGYIKIGDTFGNLVVISESPNTIDKPIMKKKWKSKCSCGRETVVSAQSLAYESLPSRVCMCCNTINRRNNFRKSYEKIDRAYRENLIARDFVNELKNKEHLEDEHANSKE